MKKTLALLLALIMLMSILTGCNSSTPAEADPTQAPSADPTPAAPSEEPAGFDAESIYAKYAGVELNFIRHSGYEADWMAEKADEFYELSGIRVNVEQIAYSEMKNKVMLDLSSPGGAYDIIATTEYWLSEFNEGNMLADQYQFINNPTLYDPSFEIEDIGSSALDANTIDGKLLAMPFKFNSQFMVYRTDLIENVPTTWEEYLSVAQANTSGDKYGVSLALSVNSVMDVYLNLLYQAGGTFLSEDNTTCNLDTPEAKKAMDFLLELAKCSSDGAINNQWPESCQLYAQGMAAMYPTVNSQLGNLYSSATPEVLENLAYAELPGQVACLTTWGLGITENCQNKEAAWLFIQYMFSPEKTKEVVIGTDGGDIPVRSSLLLSEDLATAYPHFTVMNEITQNEGHTWVYPKTTCTTAIMESLAIHVQNALLGTETGDEALSSAKAEIEDLLKNA